MPLAPVPVARTAGTLPPIESEPGRKRRQAQRQNQEFQRGVPAAPTPAATCCSADPARIASPSS